MAELTTVDVPDDVFGLKMSEGLDTHEILMTETTANGQHVHNIARHVGVKDYHEPSALEAAASEVVLRIKPLT